MSIRDELPALAGVTYLNAGTNGPMPRAALEAMCDELTLSVERPRIGMPAFEHYLKSNEIDAIIAYVRTVPVQAAPTGGAPRGGAE